jgi:hypothetical protein
MEQDPRHEGVRLGSLVYPILPIRVAVAIVASVLVLVGGLGSAAAAVLTIPAWRAAHGEGTTGTFTLTEPMSCDRWPPPRQRCGWFGDFVSDDGTVVRRDMELDGGLPPGSAVGDSLRARDTGSLAQIYPEGGGPGWKLSAKLLAGFVAAFIAGVALLRPWSWRRRWQLRQTTAGRA